MFEPKERIQLTAICRRQQRFRSGGRAWCHTCRSNSSFFFTHTNPPTWLIYVDTREKQTPFFLNNWLIDQHVFFRFPPPLLRFLWIALFLACFCTAVFFIMRMWSKWVSSPVIISVGYIQTISNNCFDRSFFANPSVSTREGGIDRFPQLANQFPDRFHLQRQSSL